MRHQKITSISYVPGWWAAGLPGPKGHNRRDLCRAAAASLGGAPPSRRLPLGLVPEVPTTSLDDGCANQPHQLDIRRISGSVAVPVTSQRDVVARPARPSRAPLPEARRVSKVQSRPCYGFDWRRLQLVAAG